MCKRCIIMCSLLGCILSMSGCSEKQRSMESDKPIVFKQPTAEALIRVAIKARKSGNLDSAMNFFKKALELEKENKNANIGIAEAYIDLNLLDGAQVYIKKALSYGASKDKANYLYGKIELLKGNEAAAEKLFKSSNHMDALNALGTVYDGRGEHQKAQQIYQKVISQDPNYADAYNNMGLSLMLSDKYEEAVFYMENACSLPGSSGLYSSNLALAYGLSGNIEKARDVYRQDFDEEAVEERMSHIKDLILSKADYSRDMHRKNSK